MAVIFTYKIIQNHLMLSLFGFEQSDIALNNR